MVAQEGPARSRRAILAAALGGVAALATQAIGRPAAVRAGSDGDVVLNVGQNATSVTEIHNQPGDSFTVFETFNQGGGIGLAGISSQSGSSLPTLSSAVGVYGYSDGVAVEGFGNSGSLPAVAGLNYFSNTGVFGFSGPFDLPATTPTKTGVYGLATQDLNARGVHGRSTAGRGVYGQATSGYGVRGYATSGTAVYAATADPKQGYALRTVGRVRLDNSAGLATINQGNISVTVTPGIDLTSTSAVVATLQGSAGGNTSVNRVSVSVTANTFTIYLTANSSSTVKVAWHVFG